MFIKICLLITLFFKLLVIRRNIEIQKTFNVPPQKENGWKFELNKILFLYAWYVLGRITKVILQKKEQLLPSNSEISIVKITKEKPFLDFPLDTLSKFSVLVGTYYKWFFYKDLICIVNKISRVPRFIKIIVAMRRLVRIKVSHIILSCIK